MEITVQNYRQARPNFDLSKLDSKTKEVFNEVDNDFDLYLELYTDAAAENDTIREVVNQHLKIVNKYLAGNEKKSTPAKKSVPTSSGTQKDESNLAKQKERFKKEGRAYFHLNNEDQFEFDKWLKKQGYDYGDTSQTGTDIQFYDKARWNDSLTKKQTIKPTKAIVIEAPKKTVVKPKPENLTQFKAYLENSIGETLYMVSKRGGKLTKSERKIKDVKSTYADFDYINNNGEEKTIGLNFGKASQWTFTDKFAKAKLPSGRMKVETELTYYYEKPADFDKDETQPKKEGVNRGKVGENRVKSKKSTKSTGGTKSTISTKKPKTKAKESPCDEAIENYLENKKEARAKASAKRERNKIKTSLDAENVNYYNAEFRLLRRFYNLVKKEKATARSIQLLYMAFQKHAVARKIRKTSDLANLYEICNKKLVKIFGVITPDTANVEIEFTDKDVLEQLAKLVANKKVDYAISLISRVINIQGTAPEDKKVERLISSIDNAFKNGKVDERSRLYDDLKKGKKHLKQYLEDKVQKIPTEVYGLTGVKKKVATVAASKKPAKKRIKKVVLQASAPNQHQSSEKKVQMVQNQTALNGAEIAQIPVNYEEIKPTPTITPSAESNNNTKKTVKKPSGVLDTSDIMNMSFDSLQFSGKWHEFMQNPAKNMKLAIWGKPKNGKTAGALAFANYLTNFGSILYNFADQGINKSTQDLWQLSGLHQKENAYLSDTRELKELDKLCKSGNYDFVFIDMINTYINRTNIKYHEFEEQFLKKYPNISFILIFEVTKTGNFKGDQGWTHLPDALITVDSFVMHNQGRYGVGEYVVWKEGLQKVNPKKYNEFFGEETADNYQVQNIPQVSLESTF